MGEKECAKSGNMAYFYIFTFLIMPGLAIFCILEALIFGDAKRPDVTVYLLLFAFYIAITMYHALKFKKAGYWLMQSMFILLIPMPYTISQLYDYDIAETSVTLFLLSIFLAFICMCISTLLPSVEVATIICLVISVLSIIYLHKRKTLFYPAKKLIDDEHS